jgi:hypothetical protein
MRRFAAVLIAGLAGSAGVGEGALAQSDALDLSAYSDRLKQDPPEDPFDAQTESFDIEEDIENLNSQIRNIGRFSGPPNFALAVYADAERTLATSIPRLHRVDCTGPEAGNAVTAVDRAATEAYNNLPGGLDDQFLSKLAIPDHEEGETDASRCQRMKESLPQNVKETFQQLRDEVASANLEKEKQRAEARKVIELLQARQVKLRSIVQAARSRSTVLDSLGTSILALGGIGLFALIAVRLFPEGVQLAWINTGTVTRFVTVLTLLGVGLALGLTEVLQETVLGTLLGGIAGHVLAKTDR